MSSSGDRTSDSGTTAPFLTTRTVSGLTESLTRRSFAFPEKSMDRRLFSFSMNMRMQEENPAGYINLACPPEGRDKYLKTGTARDRSMEWEWKKELGRKLVHFTSILIILIYAQIGQYSHELALFTLTIILVLLLEFQYFRIDFQKRPRIIRLLEKYRRKKEHGAIGGEVFFMIGAIISLAIFDFRIAVAAILMTTFGDMSAALIGKRFGTHHVFGSKKTWEGTLAGFATNLIVGWLLIRSLYDGSVWYLYGLVPYGTPVWPVIITMAATASFIELVTSKLDDNLLIPLFSGMTGQILLIILSVQIIPI
jgi:phytol kinase